jgi:putative ABC transport system permease protein
MGLMGLALGVLLGGAAVLWFNINGLSFPGLADAAAQFNLPSRVYLPITATGLLLGPSIILLASILASVYPVARLRRLEPVEAMRAA